MEVSQNKAVTDEVGTTKLRRSKPVDVAHFERRLLWFFGLYFGEVMKPHPFPKTMHLSVVLILTSLLILMIGKQFSEDRPNLLESSGILWAFVFQLIKLLIYAWSKSITDPESMLQSEIFSIHTDSQDRFVSRAVRHLHIFGSVIRALVWMFSITFLIFSPVNSKSLPLPIWKPIELNLIFWHVYEDVAFILSLLIYATVDSTILALIANTAAQFQILNDNLKNSCKRNAEESYPKQEIKIQFRLIRCIRHHSAILEYFNKMQESLSIILFGQIFYSVLGLCFCAFQFHLVPTRSLPFLWGVIYSVGYLIQIFSWSVFAEDITVQSSEISTSCFMADWYACNSKTKKLLLMIMQRATEPITLKAGPLFTMSLRTFVMILRSAYSYYTVLCYVYK